MPSVISGVLGATGDWPLTERLQTFHISACLAVGSADIGVVADYTAKHDTVVINGAGAWNLRPPNRTPRVRRGRRRAFEITDRWRSARYGRNPWRFARTGDALPSAKRSKGGDSVVPDSPGWWRDGGNSRFAEQDAAHCGSGSGMRRARHASRRLSGLCRSNQPVGPCNAFAERLATSALRNDRLRSPNMALSEPAVIEVNG